MTGIYDDPPEPTDAAVTWPKILFAVVVFLTVAALLQLVIPHRIDDDTAYHLAVSHLIGTHGVVQSFLRAPFTWLAGNYADNEFLFHLLFVPLTNLDWISAARVVGTVAGSAFLCAMYLFLRGENVRYSALWTLLPLTSITFLARFSFARPHLLAVALTFLFLWAISHEKLRMALLAGLLFPWMCDIFPLIMSIVIVASEGARLLVERRCAWKPAAVAAAGVALSIFLHPNSGHFITKDLAEVAQMFFMPSMSRTADVQAAHDMLPFQYSQLAILLLANVLMTVAAAALCLGSNCRKPTTTASIIAAVVFALLTLISTAFVDYFVPFSVTALALSARSSDWRLLAPYLLAGSALLLVIAGTEPLKALAPPEVDPSDAAFLQKNIPVGASVFNCEWDATGALTLALPQRKLVMPLGPKTVSVKDSDIYRLWYHLPRAGMENPADIIRKRFGTRFVLAPNKGEFVKFFDDLYADRQAKMVVLSDKWVFCDLGNPPNGTVGVKAVRERVK